MVQPQKFTFVEVQTKSNVEAFCQLSVNLTTDLSYKLNSGVFVSGPRMVRRSDLLG